MSVPNNAAGVSIEDAANLVTLTNWPEPFRSPWQDKESVRDALGEAYSLPTVARYCKAVRNLIYLSPLWVLHDQGLQINNAIESYAIKKRTIDKNGNSNQDNLDTAIRRSVWGSLKASHHYYPEPLSGFPLRKCTYNEYYNQRRRLSAERISSLNRAQDRLDQYIETQHPEVYTVQYLVRKIAAEYGVDPRVLTFGDYMIRHIVGTSENPKQVVKH